MKDEYQLTQAGVDELKAELEELKSQRKNLAEAIRSAREQGDLTENSEYHAAKEDQAREEGRISEIEHILQNVKLIANGGNRQSVGLGSTVELEADKKIVVYTIVGSVEANPAERKISDESPMGKALIGKKAGDSVSIELPAGVKNYAIKKIS